VASSVRNSANGAFKPEVDLGSAASAQDRLLAFTRRVPVMAYSELDDAVARANATEYGLGGSVWSADPEGATQIAARIEAGNVWVNTHKALAPHQRFAGRKWSGQGTEGGPSGLDGFTDAQFLYRTR
jgi:acyl-CoA reductase-like NAD-dependent aldehyde dehydrogenase